MPLVRIDILKDANPKLIKALSDTVYEAMINASAKH